MQLEFGDGGFVVCRKLLHVHVSGLARGVLEKSLEIRDGQKGNPWESCVDKVNRSRSIIHVDMRWFHLSSAGRIAGSGDHLAVHQSPCESADPLVQADQHASSFGTTFCFES